METSIIEKMIADYRDANSAAVEAWNHYVNRTPGSPTKERLYAEYVRLSSERDHAATVLAEHVMHNWKDGKIW